MSVFGFFLVIIFPHLDWTRRDMYSLRFQSECGKMRTLFAQCRCFTEFLMQFWRLTYRNNVPTVKTKLAPTNPLIFLFCRTSISVSFFFFLRLHAIQQQDIGSISNIKSGKPAKMRYGISYINSWNMRQYGINYWYLIFFWKYHRQKRLFIDTVEKRSF